MARLRSLRLRARHATADLRHAVPLLTESCAVTKQAALGASGEIDFLGRNSGTGKRFQGIPVRVHARCFHRRRAIGGAAAQRNEGVCADRIKDVAGGRRGVSDFPRGENSHAGIARRFDQGVLSAVRVWRRHHRAI